MNQDNRDTIARYERRLAKYGTSPKAMGWRDKEQQYMRFAILSEIGDLNNRSVLDIGCGFGDFCDFLRERKIKAEYTGYDISSKLIEIARKKHPEATFVVRNILEGNLDEKFDYIVSSGLFNHIISDNQGFLQKMLAKCFELCKIGVVANMISTYVDYQDKYLCYYHPEKVFAFSKSLTKRVTLRHDYMPYEFTVYLYKQENVDERNIFIEQELG